MRANTDVEERNRILNSTQDWRQHAACRGMDTNIFFPSKGSSAYSPAYLTIKQICAECPVRQDCLDFVMAIEHGNSAPRCGFWGGMSANARYALAAQQGSNVA